jgi:hypothetical protein
LAGKGKVKVILVDTACEKIRGRLFYGLKDRSGKLVFKVQGFVLKVPGL